MSIYEVGRWPDGRPFYAMPILPGRTLREAIGGAGTLGARLRLVPSVTAAGAAVADPGRALAALSTLPAASAERWFLEALAHLASGNLEQGAGVAAALCPSSSAAQDVVATIALLAGRPDDAEAAWRRAGALAGSFLGPRVSLIRLALERKAARPVPEWPAATLPREGKLVVCLQGTGPTGEALALLARRFKLKERSAEVRRVPPGTDLAACHVLYVAASEALRLAETLAVIAGKPILTVGDTPGFAERSIQFDLVEEPNVTPQPGTYVFFQLNVGAVKQSGLAVDLRLLASGRPVGRPADETAPAAPSH